MPAEWTLLSDKVPEPWKLVLVCTVESSFRGTHTRIVVAYFNEDSGVEPEKSFNDYSDYDPSNVVCWMDLPLDTLPIFLYVQLEKSHK
jgi:hypothetical protein